MNEPTNPLASSSDRPMRRWIEKPRMAPGQAPGGDASERVGEVAGDAQGGNADKDESK